MKKAIGVTLLFLALSAPALAGQNSGGGGGGGARSGGSSFGSSSFSPATFTPMAPIRTEPTQPDRTAPERMAPPTRLNWQPQRKRIWPIVSLGAPNLDGASFNYYDKRCVRPLNAALPDNPVALTYACRQNSYYALW
jgi:hypothetical protein